MTVVYRYDILHLPSAEIIHSEPTKELAIFWLVCNTQTEATKFLRRDIDHYPYYYEEFEILEEKFYV